MQDKGNAATVMLGLNGFVLLAVSCKDGELSKRSRPPKWMWRVAAAGCPPGCMTAARPGCGICLPVGGR